MTDRLACLFCFVVALTFAPHAIAQSPTETPQRAADSADVGSADTIALRCGQSTADVAAPSGALSTTATSTIVGETVTGRWCVATVPCRDGVTWRALLHDGDDQLVVESSYVAEADVPTTYQTRDLDRDGVLELLASDGEDPCGLTSALRNPRVYSSAQQRLRPVTLRPTVDGVPTASIEPVTAAEAPMWILPFPFTSHTRSAMPGGGAGDTLGLLTADERAWEPRTDLDGVGAWLSLSVPSVHTAMSLELRAAAGRGPYTALVATNGELSAATFSDEMVSLPLPSGTRCVSVQIADAPSVEPVALDVARVQTRASRSENWVTDWALPALEQACTSDPDLASQLTSTLSNYTQVYTTLFESIHDAGSCVEHAIYDVLNTAPANDPRRVDWMLGTNDEQLRDQVLATTELSSSDWWEAVERAPEASREQVAEIRYVRVSDAPIAGVWPLSAQYPEAADRLLDSVSLSALRPTALPSDSALARRVVAVLARASTTDDAAPDWVVELLERALEQRDGTVARVGLIAIARHRVSRLQDDVYAVLRDDPDAHLRAEALVAWLALSPSDPNNTVAELATTDPSPTVRLEAAALWDAPADELLAAALAEPWPEVQHAYAQRLVAQRADEALPLLLALTSHPYVPLPLPDGCPPQSWAPLITHVPPDSRGFLRVIRAFAACEAHTFETPLRDAAVLSAVRHHTRWLEATAPTPLALELARRWLDADDAETTFASAQVMWTQGDANDRARVIEVASQAEDAAERAAWELLLPSAP